MRVREIYSFSYILSYGGLAKANKRILEITGFTCKPTNCSICPIGLQSGCGTCLSLDKF